ncbi:MAG: hypothetical protein JOY91_02615, partial [Sinobacteraceae bacterium]|nr:hypothetical protein [Nevskiaceae bacterium]
MDDLTPAPVPGSTPCGEADDARRVVKLGIISAALYLATQLLLSRLVQLGTATVPPTWRAQALPWLALLLLAYAVAILATTWAYVCVVRLAERKLLRSQRARSLALALPVGLQIVLLCWPPLLSQDVFSYLGHGLLASLPGGNPLLQPVQAIRGSSFAAAFASVGWNTWPGITPYGILWTRVEIAVATLCGTHVLIGAYVFKALAALASLATGRLIWDVLGRLRPEVQLQGTLLYLWNPLVLFAFAAEGHNDSLMILLSVAALSLLIRARLTASVFVQLLGVLTKYYCMLFMPAQLALSWRNRRQLRHPALQVAAAFCAAAVVLVVLYAPYWEGTRSLQGVLERGYPYGAVTFVGVLRWLARHTDLQPSADLLAQGVAALALLACVLWWMRRVRTAADYAASCAWIALAFALVFSPDYWSWYAC